MTFSTRRSRGVSFGQSPANAAGIRPSPSLRMNFSIRFSRAAASQPSDMISRPVCRAQAVMRRGCLNTMLCGGESRRNWPMPVHLRLPSSPSCLRHPLKDWTSLNSPPYSTMISRNRGSSLRSLMKSNSGTPQLEQITPSTSCCGFTLGRNDTALRLPGTGPLSCLHCSEPLESGIKRLRTSCGSKGRPSALRMQKALPGEEIVLQSYRRGMASRYIRRQVCRMAMGWPLSIPLSTPSWVVCSTSRASLRGPRTLPEGSTYS